MKHYSLLLVSILIVCVIIMTGCDLKGRGPDLVFPVGDTLEQEEKYTFEWEEAHNALMFHIQISMDSNYENVVFDDSVSGAQVKIDYRCSGATGDYFWRVRSHGGDWTNFNGTEFYVVEPSRK